MRTYNHTVFFSSKKKELASTSVYCLLIPSSTCFLLVSQGHTRVRQRLGLRGVWWPMRTSWRWLPDLPRSGKHAVVYLVARHSLWINSKMLTWEHQRKVVWKNATVSGLLKQSGYLNPAVISVVENDWFWQISHNTLHCHCCVTIRTIFPLCNNPSWSTHMLYSPYFESKNVKADCSHDRLVSYLQI